MITIDNMNTQSQRNANCLGWKIGWQMAITCTSVTLHPKISANRTIPIKTPGEILCISLLQSLKPIKSKLYC